MIATALLLLSVASGLGNEDVRIFSNGFEDGFGEWSTGTVCAVYTQREWLGLDSCGFEETDACDAPDCVCDDLGCYCPVTQCACAVVCYDRSQQVPQGACRGWAGFCWSGKGKAV